eukprot:Cvel_2797.t1-p1 / transcript=Cvel_2797.t1 / gene=Cvel_2797 / organism=Chromera_velia_CCMP2878 / gene_product=hypothetical protein / transcript_product=hypothetical protein / location=Cvel_scaffold113:10927-11385(+) / protein_length=153 / sequence_SO=supercontig / SO=protein_coding / is_pseudo=false
MRSLNTQMNHVPVLAMTLTGGLWFGAGVTENLDVEIRFALLILAGVGNMALALAVIRIRDVIECYLEKIKAYHPPSYATGSPENARLPWFRDYSMIRTYAALMTLGAVLSFIGAFWRYWPFGACARWVGIGAAALLLVIFIIAIKDRRSAGET